MRIVILRALYLGDFLTGIPAYRAVRAAFPRAHIALAAPSELAPLVELLDTTFDELIPVRELAALPPSAQHADLGIDLHGKGIASHRLLSAAGARRIIAFAKPELPTYAGPPFDPDEHETVRWCRLLTAFGMPADPTDLDLRVPPLPVPEHLRGATVLHAGAASESRRWPVERWIAVARAIRRRGARVVITGSPAEVARANAIAAGADVPPAQVVAGQTNLAELGAIVAAAARVVCGDTGVAHLATAFRRPSVVLFGPTPPAHWGPPARPFHRVLWNGSTGDPHADRVDPGLAAIPVERVLAALEAVS